MFGTLNKTTTANVLGYNDEEDIVYPMRIIKNVYKDVRETVVLLLIKNEEVQQHQCVVKNLSRLLYSQTTKHRCCLRCLNGFKSENSRNKHFQICREKKR